MNTTDLKRKAIQIRKELLQMIYKGKTGHTGGALSSTDILTALYYEVLKVTPENFSDKHRNRFLLSKGHSVEGLYCILADLGFFPKEDLGTFSQLGSPLIGHPNLKVKGIEANTGALGHGLSIAVGLGVAAKREGSKARMYVLMGDGEQAEGSVWEAAMAAANYKLGNLTGIVDRNRLQISGNTEDVMALENLKEKWEAFGWKVSEINGNEMEEIVPALKKEYEDIPHLVIANTTKGKGVSFMEGVAKWHHGVPTDEQLEKALGELEDAGKELN